MVSAPSGLRALRAGTRNSALARAQCEQFARRLTDAGGRPVELVGITTEGDLSSLPVTQLSGTGVFVQAVRAAVLAGTADFAVHSAKDLPTAPAEGLVVAAVPAREDPRDVLVARDGLPLAGLPAGARVGTGSPRRASQLLALRPDLEVVPLRGNVDTRLGKVASGELDGVILAAAGLARLGRAAEATEVFGPDQMVPAPAQGALAVECRADAREVAALVARLDEGATRAAVTAERAALAKLEGGCTAPVGAYAQCAPGRGGDPGDAGGLTLTVVVSSPDGRRQLRRTGGGPAAEAEAIGVAVARQLLADGASDLMNLT
jgi:hydroxymethylbilane synthase